jgi:hypothetical protein
MLTTAEQNRNSGKPVRDTSGILNKDVMKSIEAAGGWNHFQSWKTYQLFRDSGYRGWTTIRSIVRDSPFFVPEVGPGLVLPTLQYLQGQGANLEDLYIQEIPTPELVKRHINFEVQQSPLFFIVRYGTGQCNLRHDLENNGIEVYGLKANLVLKHYLGPDCYDELSELLAQFPSVVFEATRFNQKVGTRYSELVVWEGRNY